MNFRKYIVLIVFCLGISSADAQQQTLYTNYLMNQYLYNPAYAGVEDGTQFNMGYRNQWVGFEGAPTSFMVSGYGKMKKKPNMAVGGLVTTERVGLLQRTAFYATYSYHLKINKKAAINFGLGFGGIQHKVRVYDSRPYDKDDSFLAGDVLNGFGFDANAGFYFYTRNFFLGFSDQHMPNAKILWDNSTGRNTTHFYAYTGYNFRVNKTFVIQPSILARTNSPAPYQLEYTAKLIYDDMIWAGFSYRHTSSSCVMIGCKIDNKLSFAYSYDFTLTDLNKYSSGSHELVISYLIPFKKKKSKSDLIKDADEEELNKIDNSIKTNLRSKKKNEKKEIEKENKGNENKENTELNETEQKQSESKDTPETQPEVKSENRNETPPGAENLETETPGTQVEAPETNENNEPQKETVEQLNVTQPEN